MTVQIPELDMDNFLEHHGVKGMKWGKRTGGSSSSSTKPKKAKVSSQEIMDARYRQSLRLKKAQEAQGDFIIARTNKGQDKAEKIMRQREKEYFNNPDAATAAKFTRGEKWAVGLTYGSLGLVSVAAVLSSAGH